MTSAASLRTQAGDDGERGLAPTILIVEDDASIGQLVRS